MKKVVLALLALSVFGFGLCFGQGTQPTQPQAGLGLVAAQNAKFGRVESANTPTESDMYCSGFITSEKVPETHYIVGGWNSPDQTKYASPNDSMYIYGAGLKEGDKLEIV